MIFVTYITCCCCCCCRRRRRRRRRSRRRRRHRRRRRRWDLTRLVRSACLIRQQLSMDVLKYMPLPFPEVWGVTIDKCITCFH